MRQCSQLGNSLAITIGNMRIAINNSDVVDMIGFDVVISWRPMIILCKHALTCCPAHYKIFGCTR